MRDAHHCSGPPPVSEMTYTVSTGTLNSTIPYHSCIEMDVITLYSLGLVALPPWFTNTALWLRNTNRQGSLSLGWTLKFSV